MERQLLLHWEKNFFTLVEFTRNTKENWTLHREATHDLSQERGEGAQYHQKALLWLQTTLVEWNVSKANVHCLLPAERIFLKSFSFEIPTGLENALPDLAKIEAKKIFTILLLNQLII